MILVNAAKSPTDFVIPPADTNNFDERQIPSVSTLPMVGLSAYSPPRFAGCTSEPSDSVPIASGA